MPPLTATGRSRASRLAPSRRKQRNTTIDDDDASEYAESDASGSVASSLPRASSRSSSSSSSSDEWQAVASKSKVKRKRKLTHSSIKRVASVVAAAAPATASSDEDAAMAEAALISLPAPSQPSESSASPPPSQPPSVTRPSRLQAALHFEPADASLLQSLQALLDEEEAKSEDDDQGSELEGEYERRRRKRLKANEALFEQLGLGGSAQFTACAPVARPSTQATTSSTLKQRPAKLKQSKPQYAKRVPFIYKRAAPCEDGTVTTVPLNCSDSLRLVFAYVDQPCLQSHIKEQYELRLDVPVAPPSRIKPPVIAAKDRWQVWRRIDELQARLQVLYYNSEYDFLHHGIGQQPQDRSKRPTRNSLHASTTSRPSSFWKGGRQVLPRGTPSAAAANRLLVRLKVPHGFSPASDYSSARGSSDEHNVWVRSAADVSDCASEDLDWLHERRSDDDDDDDDEDEVRTAHGDSYYKEDDDQFASGIIERVTPAEEDQEDDDDEEGYESFTQDTDATSPQFAYEEQVARLSVQASKSPELSVHAEPHSSPFKKGNMVEAPASPSWSHEALTSPLLSQRLDADSNINLPLHADSPTYSSLMPPRALAHPTSPQQPHRHSPPSASSYDLSSYNDHTASIAPLQHSNASHPLHSFSHNRPDSTPDIDFDPFLSSDVIPPLPYSHA